MMKVGREMREGTDEWMGELMVRREERGSRREGERKEERWRILLAAARCRRWP